MSGEWIAAAEFLGAARIWFASAWPAPAVEAFWLRDVSWNRASSPGMNPPGVEALVAVEEDGARGSGVVRGDSEGLFKGLAVGRPFSGAVCSRRTASPVNRCFWCWVLSDGTITTVLASRGKVLMHLLVLGAF